MKDQDMEKILDDLDDLAMMLMQVEPSNTDELTDLQESFDDIASKLSGNSQELMINASNKITRVISGEEKSDELIEDLGSAIESVMALVQGEEQKSQPKPEHEPDQSGEIQQPLISISDGSDLSLITAFIEESQDQIAEAESAMLELETDPDNMEAVNTVFRAFHTIKGTSSFLELDPLAELAHLAENLLSRVREGEIRFAGEIADLALRSVDMIKEILVVLQEVLSGGSGVLPEGYSELMAILENPGNLVSSDALEETSEPIGVEQSEAETSVSETPQPFRIPEGSDIDLVTAFVAESQDQLTETEAAMLELETDPDNMEAVNTVFRAFHTIKGTSSFLELDPLAELAHYAENLLSRIRDKEIRFVGGYADLALKSVDMLSELLQIVQNGLGGDEMFLPEGYENLLKTLSDPEAAGISEEMDESLESIPRVGDILVAQGKVDREEIEAVAVDQGKEKIGVAIVKSQSAKVSDVAQALRTQKRMMGADTGAESTIRVRTDRLDRLIDMVGELVIAHSMVAQDKRILRERDSDLVRKISHTEKIVKELQDLTMSLRMVPLKPTFQKMARLVRDLSKKVGKTITFETEGEDTEIDRNMVSIINDPLVHMIRNAVDHGIEPPDEREAAGKPRTGSIRLSAYHAGGNVIVEIQDDGRGLNKEKIVKKAIARGLIESDRGMSDNEIFNLIFAPGFSTAEQVTDVSGRGVGMDVVKRGVVSLGGKIEVASELGRGTTFTLRLPLTLAITDGMLVKVGRERYIIPTGSIHMSFRPKRSELSTVAGKGEMVMSRGELMPLFRLHRLFNIEGAVEDPVDGLLVILDNAGQRCSLLVDDLLGQQNVVAKSLGDGIGKVRGISGGAILGDGTVGLILDPAEIISIARKG